MQQNQPAGNGAGPLIFVLDPGADPLKERHLGCVVLGNDNALLGAGVAEQTDQRTADAKDGHDDPVGVNVRQSAGKACQNGH